MGTMVKDALTKEMIDKSSSLFVIPKGKKKKLYFRNKENLDKYVAKLHITEEDKYYHDLMNDMLVDLLKPTRNNKISVRVWKFFNTVRKEVDSKYCVFLLHNIKCKVVSFNSSSISPDFEFRQNYLLKLAKESKDIYLSNYKELLKLTMEVNENEGLVVNAKATNSENNLIKEWLKWR